MNSKDVGSPYAIPQPSVPTLPITGSDQLFPIRRIYCVGRNYAAHAIEMGHDPDRERPFFFQKNPDNILCDADFPYPPLSKDVHFEVELLVTLKAGGCDIPVDEAESLIFGYGVGVDFTRRDLQAQAKKQGRPWAAAKAFEASAPTSSIVPASAVSSLTGRRIWLKRNGELQQDSTLDHLIWSVPEVISELSKQFKLAAGDVIFTGTPAGVSSVQIGDRIDCAVEGIAALSFRVV